MCDKSLILSSRGLRNIVLNNQEKEEEFIFIFGEKEFKMQRMFVDLFHQEFLTCISAIQQSVISQFHN